MELFVSGVSVPPLGSYKDRILREFLSKRAMKEVYKHKILTLSAIATANLAKAPQEIVNSIIAAFEDYSNTEMYLENSRQEREILLKEEYEYWKNSRPKVNISKDGKSARLSVSSLIPKSQK